MRRRERTIHFIRTIFRADNQDGPIAVSFGAQSMLDEEKCEVIIQPIQWNIKCDGIQPPSQFTLKEFDTEMPENFDQCQCSVITKKGKQCKRMTYHESGVCWQHRISKK